MLKAAELLPSLDAAIKTNEINNKKNKQDYDKNRI